MKSFVLIILIFFTPAIMAQSYYNDEDSEREDESLPYVEIKTTRDLQQLGQQALREQKVIFLEISASYCGYCETLEEHIIKPMLRSGDYDDYVLIRKMNIDNYLTIRDFDGNKTSPAQFSYKLHAALTPTLLFIDGRGNEVSERIIGVNTLELYGQYVDDALLEGHRKIKEM